MAEAIEMFFALRTRVGPRNHVLHGDPHPHEKGNFKGEGSPTVQYRDTLQSSVQKRLNRSITELWAQIGPRNHVLDGGRDPHGRGNYKGKEAARCKE